MGYHANYDGYIKFNTRPVPGILDLMNETFANFRYEDDLNECTFGGFERYRSEDIKKALDSTSRYAKSGKVEYDGDDYTHWRFLFDNGEWIEEEGSVYYESELPLQDRDQREEFYGRLIDIVQDCMDNPEDETIRGEWYDKVRNEFAAVMKAYKVV